MNSLHSIYFLGIGGIGMSALALYFNDLGVDVHGYDRVITPLSRRLETEGMTIHYEEDIDRIPEYIDLVILTPAIPEEHKELHYFRKYNYPILKRSEVLGLLTNDKYTIAVAGTHGKTSITSLIAHIFKTAQKDFRAFVGGVSKNYNSNYIAHGQPVVMIVEADEYDRSFLRLHPNMAVITSMDADHLDIYIDRQNLQKSFNEFVGQIGENGYLIHKPGLEFHAAGSVKKSAYDISQAPHKARNIRVYNGVFHFDLVVDNEVIEGISFGLPGRYNIENALAASIAAKKSGISAKAIRKALSSYEGVQRRFDFRVRTEKVVYIDDYAHHPEELTACISAVRELYPRKKVTGIFQPHLYSRTRDFAQGFANSLESLLDDIILLDIYPAREKPIEGVSSEMIYDKISKKPKALCTKADLPEELDRHEFDILLTLGAGDIDQLVEPIEKHLKSKYKVA
ncbi:MAG: UDP-N-acetylmuramate--L-alanine ligase [Bacteroidales bacterium]|nr:UDP-N-acetylmuramate--L-alanine ligase [Bacteroidales bacterium]